jgi:hypothetical protein
VTGATGRSPATGDRGVEDAGEVQGPNVMLDVVGDVGPPADGGPQVPRTPATGGVDEWSSGNGGGVDGIPAR